MFVRKKFSLLLMKRNLPSYCVLVLVYVLFYTRGNESFSPY